MLLLTVSFVEQRGILFYEVLDLLLKLKNVSQIHMKNPYYLS
jgi:hypothetical protein